MSTSSYISDSEESEESRVILTPGYLRGRKRRQCLSHIYKDLPEPVKNRITALKKLQVDYFKENSNFCKDIFQLEKKYHNLYQPLYKQRAAIVTGLIEPPTSEPAWKENPEDLQVPDEDKPDFSELLKDIENIPEDTKGITKFWLTIFQNTDVLADMIREWDEPVLEKLTDVRIVYNEKSSFTIEFHFDKNDYFYNSVLPKTYFLKHDVDEDYPFGYGGHKIHGCKGCIINWKPKKNLTKRTITKKQKHKERGDIRTDFVEILNETFFDFFTPPQIEDFKNTDEDMKVFENMLMLDFEIGNYLRTLIIPKAILFYTGDVIDASDSEADEEEEQCKCRVEKSEDFDIESTTTETN